LYLFRRYKESPNMMHLCLKLLLNNLKSQVFNKKILNKLKKRKLLKDK